LYLVLCDGYDLVDAFGDVTEIKAPNLSAAEAMAADMGCRVIGRTVAP
jgi:hypothetical protein